MLLRFFTFLFLAAMPGPLPGRQVHDFANILSETTQAAIQSEIVATRSETTAEVVVVTVDSLENTTIEEYANILFNRWGIGRKDTNNGILFITSSPGGPCRATRASYRVLYSYVSYVTFRKPRTIT